MHEKKLEAFAIRLVGLATKLRLDDPPASSRSMSVRVGEDILHLIDDEAAEFDELCRDLYRDSGWNQKYSEHHVRNFVRDSVCRLREDNTENNAAAILSKLNADYDAYDKEHIVLVPLDGIALPDGVVNIGQVSIQTLSAEDLQTRLGIHNQLGRYFVNTHADTAFAEHTAIGEPGRAQERAIEETRRAIDVLRFSIPFLVPNDYKSLQMNVGIKGEHANADVFSLILPANHDHSMNFTSHKKGPVLPLTLVELNRSAAAGTSVF